MKTIELQLNENFEEIEVIEIWDGSKDIPPCEKLVKVYYSEKYDNFVLGINFQCGEFIKFSRNILLDIEDVKILEIVYPILKEYIEFVEVINFLKK